MKPPRIDRVRLVRLAAVATLASIVSAVLGLGVIASAGYVHSLTYPGCWHMDDGPSQVGIVNAQDVTVPSHDGLALAAWYVPPRNGAVIVLLGGLGSGRDGLLQEGSILATNGYGLLMLDTRACSLKSGAGTLGYLESLDLQEAISWLVEQPGVEHVGVLGFSAGGVTAILAAAEDQRIEAVVAEGGFSDLEDYLSGRYEHGNLIARIVFFLNPLFFRLETGIDPESISPIDVLGRISPRPLLLIYGEHEAATGGAQDQLKAADKPKELWIVPDCGHGEYLEAAGEEWERRVLDFFDVAFND